MNRNNDVEKVFTSRTKSSRLNPHDPALLALSTAEEFAHYLQTERERLTGIIESTGAGTIEWNIQTGDIIFSNKWAEMMGYTLKELENMTLRKWIDMLHPDDKKALFKK